MEDKVEYLKHKFIDKNIKEVNRRKFGIIKHDCTIQLTAILIDCIDVVNYLDRVKLEKLYDTINKIN
jgi:hypothetical protein